MYNAFRLYVWKFFMQDYYFHIPQLYTDNLLPLVLTHSFYIVDERDRYDRCWIFFLENTNAIGLT